MKKAIAIMVAGIASLMLFCGCNAGADSSEAVTTKGTTKASGESEKDLGDKVGSAIDKGMDDLSSVLE